MTIEEVIRRIKKHNEIHSRKERNAVYITEALNMAIKALEESVELKCLLKLAVEDFDFIYREHRCTDMERCLLDCPYCDEEDCCKGKWKHADEALKLIGCEKNA